MYSELKYKIGKAVRVRADLKVDTRYYMKSGYDPDLYPADYNLATQEMVDRAGEIVHILKYYGGQYEIKEDKGRFSWTDEMFEDGNPLFHGFF